MDRLSFEPEMIFIPAGPFLMGGLKSDELSLDYNYAIGKYPVTVGDYQAFVQDGGYTKRMYWTDTGWKWREENRRTKLLFWDQPKFVGNDRLPVVGVSFYEAYAYCHWLAHVSRKLFRLPTEEEWEKAAHGGLKLATGNDNPCPGRNWPWGNEVPTVERCNFKNNVGGTTPVGRYPNNASPYGVMDMAGNVNEWCISKFTYPYTYLKENDPEGDDERVQRGGGWRAVAGMLGCSARIRRRPDPWRDGVPLMECDGFRVCEDSS